MTVEEFAERYLEVRDAQAEYFHTRDRAVLKRSKALERALDLDAREIVRGPMPPRLDPTRRGPLPGQGSLFGAPP